MPENPKLFVNNIPYELCTSVQSGLPLVPTEYMKILIQGAMAAAQSLYPVTICHYIVMANHIHFLIVVKDPADVPRFMDYLKTELAHCINRLLGATGRSFWMAGYDSVMILSPEKFVERMIYLYGNPSEVGLVTSIEKFPGLNSFGSLSTEETITLHKKISRNECFRLPEGRLSQQFQKELVQSFLDGKGLTYKLKIEPWAWMQCYTRSKGSNCETILEDFLSRLRKEENSRATKFAKFLGRAALISQEIRKQYKSTRSGLKMICLSDCIEQRKHVIGIIKTQISLARKAYQKRKLGDLSALPPPGFFFPGGALIANLVLPNFLL